MSATAGGRYVLTFDVEGAGEKHLQMIAEYLINIAKQAGASGANQALKEMNRNLNEMADKSKRAEISLMDLYSATQLLSAGFISLRNVGDALFSGGANIFSAIGVGLRETMKAISPLETTILKLRVIGKMNDDQARSTLQSVNDLVAATPFMTQELNDIATGLVMGKVALDDWTDSLGNAITYGDLAAQGVAKFDEATMNMAKNVKLNALSIMADFAALTGNTGERMHTFVRGFQRMMSTGSARLLKDQVFEEAFVAMVGAEGKNDVIGTADDVIKRIYEYLKEKNALGMSALASSTADGIISNFKEIPELFFKAIGGDPMNPDSPYNKLKQAFAGMFASISQVINNPEYQQGLQRAFGPLIEKIGKLGAVIGDFVAEILKFAAAHPILTRIAAAVTIATGVFLLAAGAILKFVAALGLAALSVGGAYIAVMRMLPTIEKMLPLIQTLYSRFMYGAVALGFAAAKFIAIGLAIYGAYRAVNAFVQAHEPLNRLLTGLWAVMVGLYEAFVNWEGATTRISRDTAQKLDQAGLLDGFLTLIKGLRETQKAFQAIWEVVSGPLVDAFYMTLWALGLYENDLDKAQRKTNETKDITQDFVDAFVKGFNLMMRVGSGLAVTLADLHLNWAISAGAIRVAIAGVIALFETLFNVIVGVGRAILELGDALEALSNFDIAGAKQAAAAALSGVNPSEWIAGPAAGVAAVIDAEEEKIRRAEALYNHMQKLASIPAIGVVDREALNDANVPVDRPGGANEAVLKELVNAVREERTERRKNRDVVKLPPIILEIDGQKLTDVIARRLDGNRDDHFSDSDSVFDGG